MAVLRAPRRPGRDLRRLCQAIADANPARRWPNLLPSSSAGTARPARHAARPGPVRRRRRAATLTLSQSCPPRQARTSPSSSRWPGACWRRTARINPAATGRRIGRPALAAGADRGQPALTFVDVDAEPVPSLLRGFSAGGAGRCAYSDAQLLPCWRTTATLQPLGSRASACAARRQSLAPTQRPAAAGARPAWDACAALLRHPRWTPPSRGWC